MDEFKPLFDGPSHFINISVSGGDATPTRRKNTRTELRDMFLERRHQKVVPWFEWAELSGRGSHSSDHFSAQHEPSHVAGATAIVHLSA